MINLKIDNILINKEVNKHLKGILDKKLFSNGYIFFGPEGIGKKKTAIEFIKAIFKQCSYLKNFEEKILDINHPDFLLIEPSYLIKDNFKNRSENESPKNTKGTIRIDQIRNIKDFLSKRSIESEKKIVLITDADLLNESASNCLLKTLEEPNSGIFILLTSNLNSLLDTIISRCQLIRFKSFSYEQLETFTKNNLDSSISNINEDFNLKYLINSANGSPGRIIKNINFWNEISKEIKKNLDLPLRDNLEILKTAKLISEELEIDQQIFLINFIQNKWWNKSKNKNLVKKLEVLKSHLKSFIQPRLAWEITLLNIATEDL